MNCHDRVGRRVRVRLPRDRNCEDLPHKAEEDGQVGEILRCTAGPGGPMLGTHVPELPAPPRAARAATGRQHALRGAQGALWT